MPGKPTIFGIVHDRQRRFTAFGDDDRPVEVALGQVRVEEALR